MPAGFRAAAVLDHMPTQKRTRCVYPALFRRSLPQTVFDQIFPTILDTLKKECLDILQFYFVRLEGRLLSGRGLPGDSAVRNHQQCRRRRFKPWGRSPGGGHGNPFQYFCLENPMDRGAWWANVHGVTRSQTWVKSPSTHAQPSGKFGESSSPGQSLQGT